MKASTRIFAVGLAILVVGVYFWARSHTPAAELPEFQLSEVDPMVAAAVRSAVDNVSKNPYSAEAWGVPHYHRAGPSSIIVARIGWVR